MQNDIHDYEKVLEDKLMQEVNQSLKDSFDRHMREALGIQTSTEHDILKDIEKAICKITTVVMCNGKSKEKIQNAIKKSSPSSNVVIVPNTFVERDKVYIVTDEKVKRSLLRSIGYFEHIGGMEEFIKYEPFGEFSGKDF